MRLGLALVASSLVASGLVGLTALAACGSSDAAAPGEEAGAVESGAPDTSVVAPPADAADGAPTSDGATAPVDSLPANRDRLLGTYLAYLKSTPSITQSNGLSGAKVTGVCDLWRRLDPSAQGAFLTLTGRLQGGKLSKDGSSMLVHVTKLYRVAGGQNATATDPGSCGGAEFNRLILSMDKTLHDTLSLANTNKGQPNGGSPDLTDIQIGAGSYWRDSHDLGGPHAPFDLSDETENGAPRGQVQYFKDPTSTVATTALGRMDLTTLVDPSALEIDQDYDCPHNSNAICSYTSYGALCTPGASKTGVELYTAKFGSFDPTWQPADCAGK